MNPVAWFDIYVEDMSRATHFYETVLGINLEEMIDPTGETKMMSFPMDIKKYGAGGALVKSEYASPGAGGTQIYFGVEDCSIQEKLLVDAGGQVIRSKFSIGDFGYIVLGIDTEGNMIGFNSMK